LKIVICSASDENYRDLLYKLVLSIRNKPTGRDVAIAILDTGMSAATKTRLEGLVDHLVSPGWDIDLSMHGMDEEWFRTSRRYQAMTARASLPRYFPGYDVYLWLDADCWVQDWHAVELLIEGARDGALCIAAEIDRSYSNSYDHGELAKWSHDQNSRFFGPEVAKQLFGYPILNCGVFGLRGESPLWSLWHETMQAAITSNLDFSADQFSLNKAVYLTDFSRNVLPATCNWLANKATPMFNAKTNMFTEPFFPHQALGIVHLSWRAKKEAHRVQVIGGDQFLSSYLQYLPERLDVQR
jgi:hypothetical protein